MTIFDYLEKYAKEIPNNPAIITPFTTWSYKDLYDIIVFNQHNTKLKKHQVVILKLTDQAEYIITLLLLLSIESWVVPVSPNVSLGELEKIISLTEASEVIEDGNNPIQMKIQQCIEYLEKPESIKAGIYHMTSGSTGEPKFCIRTISNLTYEGESFVQTLEMSYNDKIINLPPLCHSYALGASCMSAIVAGAAIYTLNSFVPRKVLKTIVAEKPTIMILVPFMAKMLVNSYGSESYNFSSLRIIMAGAGKIDKDTYDLFKRKFGIYLMSNYGSTETGGLISRLSDEPYDSIGKPMQGVEFKLVNELGIEANQGEEGEIHVKTLGMSKQYLNQILMEMDEEGFFNMHDIGVKDADGNIYIKHRKKLIINIAGKKVTPSQVEEILLEYEGVDECIVTGYVKSNGNEAVKAVIATTKKLQEQEIRSYCLERLSDYKVPTKITFCRSIPRNDLGKVRYDLIKEM